MRALSTSTIYLYNQYMIQPPDRGSEVIDLTNVYLFISTTDFTSTVTPPPPERRSEVIDLQCVAVHSAVAHFENFPKSPTPVGLVRISHLTSDNLSHQPVVLLRTPVTVPVNNSHHVALCPSFVFVVLFFLCCMQGYVLTHIWP